jgi:hypothetical protein
MCECLASSIGDRKVGEPCHRDRGIVDEAIADHRGDRRPDGDRIGRDLSDLPGELTLAR